MMITEVCAESKCSGVVLCVWCVHAGVQDFEEVAGGEFEDMFQMEEGAETGLKLPVLQF